VLPQPHPADVAGGRVPREFAPNGLPFTKVRVMQNGLEKGARWRCDDDVIGHEGTAPSQR
jgi:hypothetical protein